MNKKVFIEVFHFEMSSAVRISSGSERFQIVGAANANDLLPYFFTSDDGIARSLLEADIKRLDGL